MAKRKSGEKQGSVEEKFLKGIEKEANEMAKKKSVAVTDELELQKTASVELSDMPDRVLMPKSKERSVLKLCAECGQAFVPTKGYRHCCSEACQEKRETAGSAKGAQVTKDLWAVERAKTVMVELDAKDTLGV